MWALVVNIWAEETVVGELLKDVSAPATDAAYDEHGREEIEGKADAVIGSCAVEVDVGVDALGGDGGCHGLFDCGALVVESHVACVLRELLGEDFEVRGAWVVGLIDAVTEAHDLVFLRELVERVLLGSFWRSDFVEHDHDAFVGAAVKRAAQAAYGGGDCAVDVAERADDDASAESAVVEAVISVQDEANVEGLGHRGRGLVAADHVEHVGCDGQGLIWRNEGLALTVAVECAEDGGRDGEERQSFVAHAGEVGRVGLGIDEAHRADCGAEHVHGLCILGHARDELLDVCGHVVASADALLKVFEFGWLWEATIPKEEDGFFERAAACELADGDADELEHAFLAVDERDFGFSSDDAFEAFGIRRHGGKCPSPKRDEQSVSRATTPGAPKGGREYRARKAEGEARGGGVDCKSECELGVRVATAIGVQLLQLRGLCRYDRMRIDRNPSKQAVSHQSSSLKAGRVMAASLPFCHKPAEASLVVVCGRLFGLALGIEIFHDVREFADCTAPLGE